MWNAGNATIVPPTDFGALLARAPRINEQGGSLSQIPMFNAGLAAQVADSSLRAATAVEAERVRGDSLLKIAKENNGSGDSFGDRLRSLLPILGTGSGLLGGGGSGNRFAGDALSGLLNTPLTTPAEVIGNFNTMTQGVNTSRSLVEPWTAQSGAMTRSAMSRLGS
jgi:hypothetical protein